MTLTDQAWPMTPSRFLRSALGPALLWAEGPLWGSSQAASCLGLGYLGHPRQRET